MTETPTAVETAAPEHPWRRLSPLMLAVHPVQEVVRLLPVLVGVLFLGSSNGHGPLWSLIGLGIAIALGLVRWATTTYQVTPDEVRVKRGLLRRQVLSVPRDRVRSVDLTSHIMQRLLGLSRVVIGTGRSDRKDDGVTLDALSTAEAARLREELLHGRRPVAAAAASTGATIDAPTDPSLTRPAETELVRLNPAWIRFGPFTLGGLATIGVLAGVFSQILNEANVRAREFGAARAALDQLGNAPLIVAILEVTAVLIIVVALLSTIGYVFAFWNFRLTRHREGTLHVSRGLLTTRSTTVDESRLRGVEISESLLLRVVHGARLLAITTGLRVGRGAEKGGSLLLPPAPLAEAQRVAAAVLGSSTGVTAPLVPHGPRARRRRFTRALGFAALVTVVLLVPWWVGIFPAWPWQAALALLPIGLLLAVDRYRNLGHALLGRTLVVSQGSLVRRRHVLATDGVIGLIVRESFFQRRAGLATLTTTTAAGKQHYEALDVELAEAVALADATLPGHVTPFLVPARP
ncbi:PH domain-containing protein [Pseudonocardia sp. GCM10023141]|uniref:PH domain-containing protein n=1 Tax=Pseudonocardia sp. GCM10023141 TaxID=3252653 RepID=UPI003623DEC3